MDEPPDARWRGIIRRRDLLRAAGVAGVAGVGAAALTTDRAESARLTPVKAVSVQEHGAKGDGSSDDRAAIQRALDSAAADGGGAVFFAPGDYLVSGPLAPHSNTILYGSHTPRWRGEPNPPSACKIRMAAGFSNGEGLIEAGGDTWGVTLRNLALVGDGAGKNLHGIRFPDLQDFAGNESWTIDGVTVCGFSGSGIWGTAQTTTVVNSMVHNNQGWGIDVTGGNRWNDCHLANCFLYFNASGNARFAGPQTSGLVEFANCRFERAGTNPRDLFEPLNPAAPGVRLSNARYMHFVNCTTDANCGNGFEVLADAEAPDFLPAHVGLVNCHFNRDGTGDNRSLGDYAALKVIGAGADEADQPRAIKCVNCFVTFGKADDTDKGEVFGPKYGLWYERTQSFAWIGGEISVFGEGNEYRGEANTAATLFDPHRGLLTLPLRRPASEAPAGSVYLDEDEDRLYVRSGGAWRSVRLS